jgi:tetratricopeptide (TPR) repeat protein
VRPITSVRKYAAVDQDPGAAGRELNVDIVVDGTVHRAGQQVRITARAIRVSNELTVWSGQFEEDIGNIFAVEDRVAEQITRALALKLTGEEEERLTRRHTATAEAYQLYLTGRYHWNQRTEAAIKKSVEFYSRAIANDSSYPKPYSGIADAYTALGYFSFLAPADCFPRARDAATRALELDPTLAEPHTSLAYVKLYYDWDWPGAEREFRQAIDLDPNYATAHHWYSVYLTAMERFEEASKEIRLAQQLDPTSLVIHTDIGFELYYARSYGEAVKQLQTVLEMNRVFPQAHLWLGRAYQQQGNYKDAVEEFKAAERGIPGWVVAIAAAGNVYALSGNADEARVLLRRLGELSKGNYVTPYGVALIWAGLGDRDQAFALLNKAVADRSHWLVWLKIDPRWDPIRSDSRFDDLVKRVGL